MAITLYRDTGYSLTHLVEDIKHGNIALPDIQRPFVWSAAKVRDLFDSMYRGYPVGTLMFWETGADVGTRQVGGGESDRVAKLLIVDGQQRLTSLYAVLTGSEVLTKTFERRRITIAFRPEDETFEVADAAIRKDPAFIPDVTVLWSGRYKSELRSFMAKLDETSEGGLTDERQDELEERIDRVRDLRDFRFQVIELGAAADEEQVADIFVRINSEGVKLNQADFILTLMSVHWEKGRRELEDFARKCVDPTVTGPSPRNPFLEPSPAQLLRAGVGLAFRRGRLQHVYSVLRGKDLETGRVSAERRAEQFDRLRGAQDEVLDLTNWHEYLKCLTAAGFRSRRMITSDNAIIFTYVLWLIGRRDFGVDVRTLRTLIGRWFFMAHTTGRYTSSPESQIESDLGQLRDIAPGDAGAFASELERIITANLTGDYWDITLPLRLDTQSSNSPALFAYWAALNILDASLLFSDTKVRDLLDPHVTAPRDIERHHLFPKKYLADLGITGSRQVNAIGNLAFLDWPDNAKISAAAPIDYWPTMRELVSEDALKQQCHWHALPLGWEQLDYATFLERRRQLIARVAREGFERLGVEKGGTSHGEEIDALAAADESQTLEKKSSARWNLHTSAPDPKIEHAAYRAVCAFLNADGGTLLIGVADDGTPLGLENDYSTFRQKDRDGFEQFIRKLFDDKLSVPTAGIVRTRFEQIAGHDVCVVTVAPAAKPVFATPVQGKDAVEFWVRSGNATIQLHGDDMIQYQNDHWG